MLFTAAEAGPGRRAASGLEDLRPPRRIPRNAHANSARALEDLAAAGKLGPRRRAIVEWLLANGPATDRQIRDGLLARGIELDGMNGVRPRITGLRDDGIITELDLTVRDEKTNKMVRVVSASGEALVKNGSR